jgi:hypothetical protein
MVCTVSVYFFTVTITFEYSGEGREGFLLANNQAELLLIGGIA